MQKKRIFQILTLSLSLLLTGCVSDLYESLRGHYNNWQYSVEETRGAFYKPTKYKYSNQALDNSINYPILKSTGTQKMLVIPLVFSDYKHNATTENKEALERVFFGSSSETGWESVSSFYYKSSFGQLTLTGEVYNYIHLNITSTAFLNLPLEDGYWDQSHYALESVYNHLPSSLLKQYDRDHDGYIDGAWFVYMNPYDYDSDVFWAFKYQWGKGPEIKKPKFGVYAWASFDFITGGPYSIAKPDAHTYIHETGHMMGLDDYYDYDHETKPLGGLDMMDSTLGDHNVYSKYVLNWTQPIVPTGDAIINLAPSYKKGDFILLNLNWNDHPYDEYLLIDYYVPGGLGKKDSEGEGYRGIRNFSQKGVRIYHVDSRLMKFYAGNLYPTDEIIESTTELTYLGTSNTGSYNLFDPAYKLIHLLNAAQSSPDWYDESMYADNSALFKTGTKINKYDWADYTFGERYKFNNGSNIGFNLEIGRITDDAATIYLTT